MNKPWIAILAVLFATPSFAQALCSNDTLELAQKIVREVERRRTPPWEPAYLNAQLALTEALACTGRTSEKEYCDSAGRIIAEVERVSLIMQANGTFVDISSLVKQRIAFEARCKQTQSLTQLDIVWVIDNSGSMRDHQNKLIQSASIFFANLVKLSALDWTISLLSTDTSERPYLGFGAVELNSKTPNPVTLFQSAVGGLGIFGSSREKLFEPVVQNIKNAPGFFRKDAMLALIFLTDTEDQSSVAAKDFIDFLAQTKGDLSKVVSYGILNPQDWGCQPSDDNWNYSGSRYEQVIQATQGKAFKLCDESLELSLDELSRDLIRRGSSSSSKLFLER